MRLASNDLMIYIKTLVKSYIHLSCRVRVIFDETKLWATLFISLLAWRV